LTNVFFFFYVIVAFACEWAYLFDYLFNGLLVVSLGLLLAPPP